MTSEYKKPLPYPTPETQRFWAGCKKHQLWLPFCSSCEHFFFYPRPFCPRCFSWTVEWKQASGRGTLYTFAIQYRPQAPGFQPPYVTAIVQLDEGPRLMTNLLVDEPEPGKIECDIPVEVVFEDVSEEISLPMFRPVAR
jgi:uncharacterized OB-fold protein